MNSEEAKFVLHAYRPGTGDAQDSQFAMALAQVRRDPELAKWLEDQSRFDVEVRAKLCSIPVPSNLRAKILAGRNFLPASTGYGRGVWMALAAALALMALVMGGLWPERSSGDNSAQWEHDMVATLGTDYRLDHLSRNIREVEHWLEDHAGEVADAVPERLRSFPTYGCRTFRWNDRKVAMVCFDVEGNTVHLFILDREDGGGEAKESEMHWASRDEWVTARWSDAKAHYLIAGKGDPQKIRNALL